MTKAELRQMLTEAVRNTQPRLEHRPKRLAKAKTIATGDRLRRLDVVIPPVR
ncbi:hypothetical protein ACVW0I_004339 [Bradyrhizobium sp. LM6.11]